MGSDHSALLGRGIHLKLSGLPSSRHSEHSQLVGEKTEAHVVSLHEVISPCEDNWHVGFGLAHFLLYVRKFHLYVLASLEGRAKN